MRQSADERGNENQDGSRNEGLKTGLNEVDLEDTGWRNLRDLAPGGALQALFDWLARMEDEMANPWRQVLLGGLSIMLGTTAASSVTTITGALAIWDPIVAFVIVVWMELFTKLYYSRPRPSLALRLVNAFKIGLLLGFFLDVLKLAG